jgi:hypothetical protein
MVVVRLNDFWDSLTREECHNGAYLCANGLANPEETTVRNQPKDTKNTDFWTIAPCSLVEIDGRFRVVSCLHH